jgi:hypothetical protein
MKTPAYLRWISVALKIAIVSLATGYILLHFFTQQEALRISSFFYSSLNAHPFIYALVLLLMPVNWFFEALKWKIIAAVETPLTIAQASRGVLAGVAIGMATPNRVGEFAGRIFMTRGGDRVHLLLLSFVSSFCQVAVTIACGLVALLLAPSNLQLHELYYSKTYYLYLAAFLVIFLPPVVRVIAQRNREKLEVLARFPPRKFAAAIGLSFFRYVVYSGQFLLLLSLTPGFDLRAAAVCIAVAYLLVTIIPTFSITEVLVRGSVAGAVFSTTEVSFGDAFYVAVILWAINVALPALAGCIFVFRLRFFKSDKL